MTINANTFNKILSNSTMHLKAHVPRLTARYYTERVLETYSFKSDVSIKSLPSDLRVPVEREVGECKSQKGQKTPGGDALWINWASVIWTQRDWNSRCRAYMDLHQVFCMNSITPSSVFLWDSWVWEWVGLWFLCLLLGFLFLLLVCLVQIQYDFFLSYNAFCYV